MSTESPSPFHTQLDAYATRDLVAAFVDDQSAALDAVRRAREDIARAVDAAVPRLRAGGRLVYVGAGTSGRLGLLDGVELHPTFSWPAERAIAILAGGHRAIMMAVEGAEDDRDQGGRDVAEHAVGPNDVVLLLAASGRTPYVLGALDAARRAGALTIGIANNVGAPVAESAEIGIVLDTGPEIISGSTRLKAGTSQKIALNTFSSAVMVKLHKVHGNLMVDVKPTNAKLYRRATALVVRATGADDLAAERTLRACDWRVKVAIVAIASKVDVGQAIARLEAAEGSVRRALGRG
jgi:N-acetylmuramic acid 6-phosphate etherase